MEPVLQPPTTPVVTAILAPRPEPSHGFTWADVEVLRDASEDAELTLDDPAAAEHLDRLADRIAALLPPR